MSLAEIITCYNALIYEIDAVDFICYTGLNNLYFNSVKWLNPNLTMETAIRHLVNSNILCFKIF